MKKSSKNNTARPTTRTDARRKQDVPQSKESVGEIVWSWTRMIASSLLIVMVVSGLLVASFVVPTPSMANEVMAGDFLFVNRFLYGGSTPQTIPFLNTPLPYLRLPGLRDPQKGDVIVFIFPGNRDQPAPSEFQYYLKRCVATAGDTLEVRNKKVFINGAEQPAPPNARFEQSNASREDHLNTFPEGAHFTRDNWGPMRIPKEGDVIPLDADNFYQWQIFIMREGHQVELTGEIVTIDGTPATSYTVERDYCFGMGDNRDRSADSRYWGFIPYENIVGTPLVVYWSWDPDLPLSQLGSKLSSIRWDRIFSEVE